MIVLRLQTHVKEVKETRDHNGFMASETHLETKAHVRTHIPTHIRSLARCSSSMGHIFSTIVPFVFIQFPMLYY